MHICRCKFLKDYMLQRLYATVDSVKFIFLPRKSSQVGSCSTWCRWKLCSEPCKALRCSRPCSKAPGQHGTAFELQYWSRHNILNDAVVTVAATTTDLLHDYDHD